MLDHAVAERDVEAAVRVVREVDGVADGGTDVLVGLFLLHEVDERDRYVVASRPAALLPELAGTADVDHAQRPRQRCGEPLEALEAVFAHAVAERVGAVVVRHSAEPLGHRRAHAGTRSWR